ncbi:MAG: carbonate dehydratase [Chlamydiales bacterium]|jgi:carbonic anhydrase|nr:carbonate dehydratase [Chlamydiales bacterium]
MEELELLFKNNRAWAQQKLAQDASYFEKLARGQSPRYLWIGCSDSRIPANEVVGLEAGELFVHRNIANLFIHTDFSSLSVLEFAVDYLKVQHVIVCGHYGCAGVNAAMEDKQLGLVDNWIRSIRDTYAAAEMELSTLSYEKRYNRLVEINTVQQVMNICHTTIVQNAWRRHQPLWIHGWVYDLKSGLLKDLNCCFHRLDQLQEPYHTKYERSSDHKDQQFNLFLPHPPRL